LDFSLFNQGYNLLDSRTLKVFGRLSRISYLPNNGEVSKLSLKAGRARPRAIRPNDPVQSRA
jgi:hypothetical protein